MESVKRRRNPFLLALTLITPHRLWVTPLFETVKPLSDERVERAVLDLAARANVTLDGVYVQEMSSVTSAANAHVTGIGSNLRVVIWDTALTGWNDEQPLFVLAHEMGHVVKGQTLILTLYALLGALILIGIGGW